MLKQQLVDKLFVTDKTISSWESNRTEPDLETIIRISEILEEIMFLYYLINEM